MYVHSYIKLERERERARERDRDRETERKTDRQTDRERSLGVSKEIIRFKPELGWVGVFAIM